MLKFSKLIILLGLYFHTQRKILMYVHFYLQEEISRYKKLYQEMYTERNQFKQQCTQGKSNFKVS